AAVEVVRKHPGVGFVLCGDGPLRPKLTKQIAELGLKEHVVLVGFRGDLDRFMPFFDVFALPSFTEGLPNVALEAMAASVPVVATAVGGTPEVVADGETGLLVPAGDAAALARSLGELLAYSRQRQELAQNGRQLVESAFGFAAHAEAYRGFFARLLAGRAERIVDPMGVGREHHRLSRYSRSA